MSYTKVLDGSARYDGRSAFRTWFFGVIRRTAAEQRRQAWLRPALLERWWKSRPTPAPPTDPEKASSRSEVAEMLNRALVRLSPRQQEVLHLVFYQQLTLEEAAGVLAIPVGTARIHYERGKRRLRQLLPREVRP